MNIIITIGCPASGKTTWAKNFCKENSTYRRINKDNIREMLGQAYSPEFEKEIVATSRSLGISFLLKGLNIIIDDTNLKSEHIEFWTEYAKNNNHTIEEKIFDESLETLLKRDSERANSVGEDVIKRMYKTFRSKYKISIVDDRCKFDYIVDPSKEECIIVDLDGTASLINGRGPYSDDFSTDKPNTQLIKLVNILSETCKVIIITGRNEKTRENTIKMIERIGMKYDELYMRPENRERDHDYIIKNEIYDAYVKDKYNVLLALEDRDRCVKMFRDLGICTLQPYYGDF